MSSTSSSDLSPQSRIGPRGLTPADAIQLANVAGSRQVPFNFGVGHELGVVLESEAILDLIRQRAPLLMSRRSVADGKRSLRLYQADRS